MPCYTVKRMSIEFQQQNHELLRKAIEELGWVITGSSVNTVDFYVNGSYVSIGGGKIRLDQGMEHVIDTLKREYTKQAVKKATSRYGWASKQTAENQFTVTRR